MFASRSIKFSDQSPGSGSLPQAQNPELDAMAALATKYLGMFAAIDTQSFEDRSEFPSSNGQLKFADQLAVIFSDLEYNCQRDEFGNLVVRIPASSVELQHLEPLAFLVHIDTSEGTKPEQNLSVVKEWDGSEIPYRSNPNLHVSAANYPDTKMFIGQDVVFGSGTNPFGLDCKAGCAELTALGHYLKRHPEIEHGPILLVFRPDEEIGRDAVVEGLAERLKQQGVKYGYTVDGVLPFEINTENFEASEIKLEVVAPRELLTQTKLVEMVGIDIVGVTTHGISSKSEGHLNAITVFARTCSALAENKAIYPGNFRSDRNIESNGRGTFFLMADSPDAVDRLRGQLYEELQRQIEPHEWKGAGFRTTPQTPIRSEGALRLPSSGSKLARLISDFEDSNPGYPLLPENSEGYDGYSNPYFALAEADKLYVRFRLRDFSPEALATRESHVGDLAKELFGQAVINSTPETQYHNMGEQLNSHPTLVSWAKAAAAQIGVESPVVPMRGGLGVDPFLNQGIYIANLGAGYFAPESGKEFTTRQMLGQHTLWLAALVQQPKGQKV
jgi:di/tripeptidase